MPEANSQKGAPNCLKSLDFKFFFGYTLKLLRSPV